MDEDGTLITGLVCGEAVETYDSILIKGRTYLISNGEVKIAAKKFSSVKNDFGLILDGKSIIEQIEDDKKIQDIGFNFTPIKRIANLMEGTMVDVIGAVRMSGGKQIHVYKKKNNTEEKSVQEEKIYKKSIVLCDDGNEPIEVTLWRDLAEKDLKLDIIVGLKRMKITTFNNLKQLSSTNGTEIVVDPFDPKTSLLKQKYDQ